MAVETLQSNVLGGTYRVFCFGDRNPDGTLNDVDFEVLKIVSTGPLVYEVWDQFGNRQPDATARYDANGAQWASIFIKGIINRSGLFEFYYPSMGFRLGAPAAQVRTVGQELNRILNKAIDQAETLIGTVFP